MGRILDLYVLEDAIEFLESDLKLIRNGRLRDGEKLALRTLKSQLDYEKKLGMPISRLIRFLDNPIYIKKDFIGNEVNKTEWCSNRIIGNAFKDGHLLMVDNICLKPQGYGTSWGFDRWDVDGEE